MPSLTTIDLYEILQVSPRAHADVIAAAYRALARRHHPDTGGDAQAMISINHAWEVLGNPRKRIAYDRVRRAEEAARAAPATAAAASAWSSSSSQSRSGPTGSTSSAHPAPPPSSPRPAGAADAGGSVLDFGRYAGWSIDALVKADPDYLLWLARTPIGRRFRHEIDERLAAADAAASARPAHRPLFRSRRFGFAGAR